MALGNDSYDEADPLAATNVQVVNTHTGEILEWDISTDTAMAMAYDELTGLEGAIKRAKDKIKARVIARMGVDNTLDVSMAYRFERSERATGYEYYLPELRKWFDEDAINDCLKVDTKKVAALVKDYIEAGYFTKDEAKAISELRQPVGYAKVFKLNVLR